MLDCFAVSMTKIEEVLKQKQARDGKRMIIGID